MTRSGEEALAKALHEAGIRCDPNIVRCRATHRGHAKRLLAAMPVETHPDGHEGHWRLTLWWDPVPPPPITLDLDG